MGYIYKADVYCDNCGDAICERIKAAGKAPEDTMDHNSYKSDDYPKSADVEHAEADSPQHCAVCGEFLRNPLTSEGYSYVTEAINDRPMILQVGHAARPDVISQAWLRDWASWYNFRYWDAEDCADESNGRKVGWYSDEAF